MGDSDGTEAASPAGIARCLSALAEEARSAGLPRTARAITTALLACRSELRPSCEAARNGDRRLN